jgi:hypothetical protein
MKPNIFFIFSFILMVFVSFMVVFCLNKFLFFIHGYNVDTTKVASAEAFEAYKTIYKSKVLIIVACLILSIVLLLFARKLTLQNPHLIYKVVHGICWLITIIFLILCTLFIFLPKGPLV